MPSGGNSPLGMLLFPDRSRVLTFQTKGLAAAVSDAFHAEVLFPIKRWADTGGQVWWLIGAMLIAVGVRGYFLAQPMRYDESYTFLNFVNGSFENAFFYPLPNNHVFHSLLVKAVTAVFGPHPATIRLPAFAAGVTTVAVVYGLCRQLNVSGVFAAFAAAVCPMLISYSANARGYSLLVLLSVALVMVGLRLETKRPVQRVILFGVIASLGMFTIPSMVLPVAGILCWLFCLLLVRGEPVQVILLRVMMPMIAIIVLGTLLFYAPVVAVTGSVKPIIANRFVTAQPWPVFLSGAVPHAGAVVGTFVQDIPPAILAIGGGLVSLGLYAALTSRNWALLSMVPVILCGAVLVVLVRHRIPFVRTWLFMIPFFLVLADAGFTFLATHVSARLGRLLKLGMLVVALDMAVTLTATNAIARYTDTGHFPEAEQAAVYLKQEMRPGDRIRASIPADWPTYFYLWYHRVPDPHREHEPGPVREYYVMPKGGAAIGDLTNQPVRKLLDWGRLEIYRSVGLP